MHVAPFLYMSEHGRRKRCADGGKGILQHSLAEKGEQLLMRYDVRGNWLVNFIFCHNDGITQFKACRGRHLWCLKNFSQQFLNNKVFERAILHVTFISFFAAQKFHMFLLYFYRKLLFNLYLISLSWCLGRIDFLIAFADRIYLEILMRVHYGWQYNIQLFPRLYFIKDSYRPTNKLL